MLTDYMNILEMALHWISLVDRRHAGGLINAVDDLDRQMNRVRGGEAQGRAPLLGSRARRCRLGPKITDRLSQEGSSGSEVGFALSDRCLNHRLIAERCLHGPRCLGAGELEKRGEAGASNA